MNSGVVFPFFAYDCHFPCPTSTSLILLSGSEVHFIHAFWQFTTYYCQRVTQRSPKTATPPDPSAPLSCFISGHLTGQCRLSVRPGPPRPPRRRAALSGGGHLDSDVFTSSLLRGDNTVFARTASIPPFMALSFQRASSGVCQLGVGPVP